MAIQEQILGQLRNATGGTAESLYSPGSGETAYIQTIIVCNQSGTADTYRIFVDDDGTTYDATTALFYDVAIAAGATHVIAPKLNMNDATGNLAVSCATTNACTFTASGAVRT